MLATLLLTVAALLLAALIALVAWLARAIEAEYRRNQ